jgi:hypothetical protein
VVIMGCGHEDAMHTLKKRFENRRLGGQCVSPTKTLYVFRCGESGLYALTADPKGHILPSRIYPRVRWQFERRLTLRLDRKSPKGKIVRATLDAPCPLIPGSLVCMVARDRLPLRWQCDRNTRLKTGIAVA